MPFLRILFGIAILVLSSFPAFGQYFDTGRAADVAVRWTRPFHGRRFIPAWLIVYLAPLVMLAAVVAGFILLGAEPGPYLLLFVGYGVFAALAVRGTAADYREAERIIQRLGAALLIPSHARSPFLLGGTRTAIELREPSIAYRDHLRQMARQIPMLRETAAPARLLALEIVATEILRVDTALLATPSAP